MTQRRGSGSLREVDIAADESDIIRRCWMDTNMKKRIGRCRRRHYQAHAGIHEPK